jgi:hypothetical protein
MDTNEVSFESHGLKHEIYENGSRYNIINKYLIN